MCGFVQRFGADCFLHLHVNLRCSWSGLIMDAADLAKTLIFLYQSPWRHFGKFRSLSTLSWGPQISPGFNSFRVCLLCPPDNFGIRGTMQTLSVFGGVAGEWCCRPRAAESEGRQKEHFNNERKWFVCTQQILNHWAKLKEIFKKCYFFIIFEFNNLF